MIVSDAKIRERVSAILSEDFRIDAPLGREYNLEIEPASTSPLTYIIVNKFISNLIDVLTTKKDGTNLAWRYIAEGLLINNAGYSDLNESNPQFVFADVEKAGVKYSIKSSFQKRSTSVWTPISNHPIYTNQFMKKSDFDQFGVITCHRQDINIERSRIVWAKIGTITSGADLKEKARKFPSIEKIRNKSDFNLFFDEENFSTNTGTVRAEVIMSVEFKNDVRSTSQDESENDKLQKINFIAQKLDALDSEELNRLVALIQDKIKISKPKAV